MPRINLMELWRSGSSRPAGAKLQLQSCWTNLCSKPSASRRERGDICHSETAAPVGQLSFQCCPHWICALNSSNFRLQSFQGDIPIPDPFCPFPSAPGFSYATAVQSHRDLLLGETWGPGPNGIDWLVYLEDIIRKCLRRARIYLPNDWQVKLGFGTISINFIHPVQSFAEPKVTRSNGWMRRAIYTRSSSNFTLENEIKQVNTSYHWIGLRENLNRKPGLLPIKHPSDPKISWKSENHSTPGNSAAPLQLSSSMSPASTRGHGEPSRRLGE